MLEDRRQPAVQTRLPTAMLDALRQASELEADGNQSDMVRSLVREGLSRRGLWPPTAGQGGDHAR